MWRRILFALLFIPALIVFNAFYTRLPVNRRVLGTHQQSEGFDQIAIYETNSQAESGLVQATLGHEVFHALKAKGYFDRDVPYAAALGFYMEWKNNGKLYDREKNDLLLKGRATSQAMREVLKIVRRYDENTHEDARAYEDAAYLVGLSMALFPGDADAGERYIICLSISVEPEDALELSGTRDAYPILWGLRTGQYVTWDERAFSTAVAKISDRNQQQLIHYKEFLKQQYEIAFVKKESISEVDH